MKHLRLLLAIALLSMAAWPVWSQNKDDFFETRVRPILATVFFGSLETQTDSSMAIQSGAPGTSNTASGFSAVIDTRTPGAFTPGLGGRAGLESWARRGRRI